MALILRANHYQLSDGRLSAWSTLHWALLVSALTVVPCAAVLGTDGDSWRRVVSGRPAGAVESSLARVGEGALLGAWLGAWPMPLDWERPWQEWPITPTCGLLGGYLVGLVISLVVVVQDFGSNWGETYLKQR
eukprot:jgi/Mesen1/7283/ME000373S06358